MGQIVIAIIVLVEDAGTFYGSGSDLSLWPWLMVAVLIIIVVMDYIKSMDYGFHDCEYGFYGFWLCIWLWLRVWPYVYL